MTVHRNQRQNFVSMKISPPSGMPMKLAQMEQSGLGTQVDLVGKSGLIQFELCDSRVPFVLQCTWCYV